MTKEVYWWANVYETIQPVELVGDKVWLIGLDESMPIKEVELISELIQPIN